MSRLDSLSANLNGVIGGESFPADGGDSGCLRDRPTLGRSSPHYRVTCYLIQNRAEKGILIGV